MKTGTTKPNRLLRLDSSVYDQFAPASDHIHTVKSVGHHIKAHLGPIEHIVREKVQGKIQIDIQIIAPSPNRNHVTLITSGMSDQPMTTPINLHQYRFAELYMRVPASWTYDFSRPDSEAWPIDLLLKLARLPHQNKTWLGYGHSISFEDLAPCSNPAAFTGVLLASSLLEYERFQTLQASPGKRIHFYNVCPLHNDELELVQQIGPTYMEDLLISQGLTGAFDVHRQSVLASENPTNEEHRKEVIK